MALYKSLSYETICFVVAVPVETQLNDVCDWIMKEDTYKSLILLLSLSLYSGYAFVKYLNMHAFRIDLFVSYVKHS